MMKSAMSHRSPVTRQRRPRAASRGQIVVIFAGAVITFIALCAIVVDISWYWANTLRVQRAADAAALAGAVYLPNDSGTAFAEAKAAAKRNGYADGKNGVTVTPWVDDNDPRQLDVRIDGTVGSFFAHVVGIDRWGVSRVGQGVYIQPVPMGSPDAYYGVGDYYTYVSKIVNTPGSTDSGADVATTSPGIAGWTPTNGSTLVVAVQKDDNNGGNTPNASANANNVSQRWGSFGLTSQLANNQSVTKVDGIRVYLRDAFLSQSCNNSTNRINVQLSWDGGTTWSTPATANQTSNLGAGTNDYTFGDNNSLTDWQFLPAHTWQPGDLADGKLEVRLTSVRANNCSAQLRVDQIQIQAYYEINTQTTTKTLTKSDVKYPMPNGTTLPSRGAWGAMITRGGNHENGDAYGPANDGGASSDYDSNGYDYIVTLPSGGTVNVFDPGFCAMGQINAGSIGTGDHWIGGPTNPVSTYYTLWNTGGKPGLRSTWTKLYTSDGLFEKQKGYDPDNIDPNDGPPNGATSGCDQYHDTWWQVPTGSLAPGQYAIQVQTSRTSPPSPSGDAGINASTNAENMFALYANGGGAQIYGNGRMAAYNNLRSGQSSQQFYLAQVDRPTGASKTMLIDIFDPGDVAGDAVLKVLSPNGGAQTEATFTYTTDSNCRNNVSDACSRTNVKQITTANNGNSSFNNTWVHITIQLPASYGSGGLWQNGWWQIKYQTPDGGNDTTTWQVNMLGNPVHLVAP